MGPKEATAAGNAFREASKQEKAYRLDGGVPVRVVGNQTFIAWAQPVVGKTVAAWLYQSNLLKQVMGKGKKAEPVEWGPCGATASLGLAPTPATSMPMAAQDPSGTQGYPGLPPRYFAASLERDDWFGTVAEPAKPLLILKEYGFLILRGFVPDIITAPARSSVELQFKRVMGSLTEGNATQDFDKLAGLPAKVWEHKVNPEVEDPIVKLSFPFQSASGVDALQVIGLDVNVDGFVMAVKPNSLADKQGVKMGWQVLERLVNVGNVGSVWSLWRADGSPKASSGNRSRASPKPSQKAAQAVTHKGTHIKFKMLDCFSHFALTQKWSVSQNAGYMKKFGGGKLTKPQFFEDMRGLREAQLYMRLVYFLGWRLGCECVGPLGNKCCSAGVF